MVDNNVPVGRHVLTANTAALVTSLRYLTFITLYFPSAGPELIEWHNQLFQVLGYCLGRGLK